MKKNYFLLAATTMMFAACAQTDMVNEVVTEEAPQAIGFDAFANKTTRAEINGVEGLKTANFKVWGYKAPKVTVDDATTTDWTKQQTVFGENGTIVEFKDNAWKPEDTKYWDKMTNYNFYAAAPAEPTGGATYSIQSDMDEATPGYITITNVASGKSTDSNDFLIARGGAEGIDGDYTDQHSAVAFAFHHTMAKLSFKLAANIAEDITVTSLKMTGWDKGVGTFTQIHDATPTTLEDSEWEITTAVSGEAILVGTGAGDVSVELLKSKAAVELEDTYIMVPQTIAANTLTFTINYEIDGETYTAHVGKIADEQVWGTDSHTTYTITVGPDQIDFSVTVCDWDNKNTTPDTTIE